MPFSWNNRRESSRCIDVDIDERFKRHWYWERGAESSLEPWEMRGLGKSISEKGLEITNPVGLETT